MKSILTACALALAAGTAAAQQSVEGGRDGASRGGVQTVRERPSLELVRRHLQAGARELRFQGATGDEQRRLIEPSFAGQVRSALLGSPMGEAVEFRGPGASDGPAFLLRIERSGGAARVRVEGLRVSDKSEARRVVQGLARGGDSVSFRGEDSSGKELVLEERGRTGGAEQMQGGDEPRDDRREGTIGR